MTDWQSISTVPRDGTFVLVCDGMFMVVDAWSKFGPDNGWSEIGEPTHWMPLPELPHE